MDNTRPQITHARTVAEAERLVADADLASVGKWWESGFGTDRVSPEVAEFLVERGAPLSVHAAAGLGLTGRLQEMLVRDPSLVHAKGGDDCTPLHFSRDLATARLLLDHGAAIDARDGDHDSTPAQWLIRRAPEVTQFLLEQGAAADIFMAAGLGDRALAESLIAADRNCLAQRIGKSPAFPPLGNGRGGTIYQWTLAFNSYSHQVAVSKGHEALYAFLYEQSDTPTKLLVSCLLGRRSEAEGIAAAHPGLVKSLPEADLELPARYCWETNTNLEAVRLMLDLGFPVDHPERSHGYSPLHNAAWAGTADLVDLLIARGHPVATRDPVYHATPLGFAIHCATVAKRHPEGEYGRVAKALVEAGTPLDDVGFPTGHAAIDEVLRAKLG